MEAFQPSSTPPPASESTTSGEPAHLPSSAPPKKSSRTSEPDSDSDSDSNFDLSTLFQLKRRCSSTEGSSITSSRANSSHPLELLTPTPVARPSPPSGPTQYIHVPWLPSSEHLMADITVALEGEDLDLSLAAEIPQEMLLRPPSAFAHRTMRSPPGSGSSSSLFQFGTPSSGPASPLVLPSPVLNTASPSLASPYLTAASAPVSPVLITARGPRSPSFTASPAFTATSSPASMGRIQPARGDEITQHTLSDVESVLESSEATTAYEAEYVGRSDEIDAVGGNGFERIFASFPSAMAAFSAQSRLERSATRTPLHRVDPIDGATDVSMQGDDEASASSQSSSTVPPKSKLTYDKDHVARLVRPRPRPSLKSTEPAESTKPTRQHMTVTASVDAALATLYYPLAATIAWFIGLGYIDAVAPYLSDHINIGLRALALAPGWILLALVAAWGIAHGLEAARTQPLLLALGAGVAWFVYDGGKQRHSPLPRFPAQPTLRPAPMAWGWATVGDWASWTGDWSHF